MDKLLCKFADWLYAKVYDEPTYEELLEKNRVLESKVEELEDEVAFYESRGAKNYDEGDY